MTSTGDDRAPLSPRRPPAPRTQWATVTRIGERRAGEDLPADATGSAPVDGSLALSTDTQARLVPGPPRTPELRLVEEEGHSAEVQVWAARFAQAVVEVLGGDRPLSQLVRWTSRRVYLELERRLTVLARTPVDARRRRTVRPQVRSVRVCHPTAEAAEVSVHVRYGRRSRAIAARLELVRGRWQCTVLQLG
jgi:hypothetical protein